LHCFVAAQIDASAFKTVEQMMRIGLWWFLTIICVWIYFSLISCNSLFWYCGFPKRFVIGAIVWMRALLDICYAFGQYVPVDLLNEWTLSVLALTVLTSGSLVRYLTRRFLNHHFKAVSRRLLSGVCGLTVFVTVYHLYLVASFMIANFSSDEELLLVGVSLLVAVFLAILFQRLGAWYKSGRFYAASLVPFGFITSSYMYFSL